MPRVYIIFKSVKATPEKTIPLQENILPVPIRTFLMHQFAIHRPVQMHFCKEQPFIVPVIMGSETLSVLMS